MHNTDAPEDNTKKLSTTTAGKRTVSEALSPPIEVLKDAFSKPSEPHKKFRPSQNPSKNISIEEQLEPVKHFITQFNPPFILKTKTL